MRTLEPLLDRVIIKMISKPDKVGSIYVPDPAKEKPSEGTIIAVGPGENGKPMLLSVGDVVVFGRYSGNEVELDGETLLVVKQGDIIGVVKEAQDGTR